MSAWGRVLAIFCAIAGSGVLLTVVGTGIAVATTTKPYWVKRYLENGAIILAGFLFFPVTLLIITFVSVLVAYRRFVQGDDGSELTRKQQRSLAFEREQLKIAEERLRIQEEYERLMLEGPSK